MKTTTRRLLSVDWDFFTMTEGCALEREHPQMYDWGHREGIAWLDDVLWASRAASFDRFKLPRPSTSGEETTFWGRFTFARTARLFLMESHKDAATLLRDAYHEVWNFDAHHDCGYCEDVIEQIARTQSVDCGSWMAAFGLMRGSKLFVRYPRWKEAAFDHESKTDPALAVDRAFDGGAAMIEPFTDVVLARSGSWTPPWLDDRFWAFVNACPLKRRRTVGALPARVWDENNVQQMSVIVCASTTTKEQSDDRS